jgi:hypothetical protein
MGMFERKKNSIPDAKGAKVTRNKIPKKKIQKSLWPAARSIHEMFADIDAFGIGIFRVFRVTFAPFASGNCL